MSKSELDKLNNLLNRIFKELSISKINYTIDFWHLEFGRHFENDKYEIEEINDIWLTTHELEVVSEREWLETIKKGPFDISDSIDFQESIKALVLFHLARLPIKEVELKENADLIFKYSRNRFLKIKGIVEVADWIWWLDIGKEEKLVMSNFGELVADENKINQMVKNKEAS
ncbi:MAG: hypothetical protein AAF960_20315 [Bacteroidota bacterium]